MRLAIYRKWKRPKTGNLYFKAMVKPFTLDGNLYDLNTYQGRYKHFASMVDPRLLLYTEKDGVAAKKVLRDFELSVVRSKDATDEKLWEAKRIRDSVFHPQTGEALPFVFRLANFAPVNVPICAGMLLSAPTMGSTIFWQWVNQSYNAGFNFTHRNTSKEQADSDILKAYAGASIVSCTSAVGLGKLVHKANHLKPVMRSLIQRTVPFAAVASAGVFNALFMRINELNEGIDVTDEHGRAYGTSKVAAKKSLTEVALTRIVMPIPVLLLPPYILEAIATLRLMPKNRFGKIACELSVISVCLLGAVPLSVALFPQQGSIATEKLEPQFQNLHDSLESKIETLYYNKGI